MPIPTNHDRLRRSLLQCAALAPVGCALPTLADDEKPAPGTPGAPRYGKPVERTYEIASTLITGAQRGTRISFVTVVPMDWPEQQVVSLDIDHPDADVRTQYKTVAGGCKAMIATAPKVNARERFTVAVTARIKRRPVLAPEKTDHLVVAKRIPAKLGQYLRPSPLIESTHPTIRTLATEATDGVEGGWATVNAIRRAVLAKLTYKFARKNVSTLEALETGIGDCGEMSSLFIALCRAVRIPARLVHVPGHAYAEFYLEESPGVGHWYPVETVGGPALGSLPRTDMILQKGDRFRLPEDNRTRRIAVPVFKGVFNAGGSPPRYETSIREEGREGFLRSLPRE